MTLKELIDSEPANAARTDEERRSWTKELVNQWQDVSWLDFNMWRTEQAITRAFLEGLAVDANDAKATGAQYMLDCVVAGQPLSMSDARVRAVIQAMGMPTAKRNALQAMAQIQVERWVDAEIPVEPNIGDFAVLRNEQ